MMILGAANVVATVLPVVALILKAVVLGSVDYHLPGGTRFAGVLSETPTWVMIPVMILTVLFGIARARAWPRLLDGATL